MEIARIERSYQRYGQAFLERIYTPGEIAYCMAKRNFAESLTARFAAKEATAKALGTGIKLMGNGNRGGIGHREVEVRRRPGQRPELHLSGRAALIAEKLGIHRLDQSIAIVIAED
jgi:holo-[acyl-carrier protein] synthase